MVREFNVNTPYYLKIDLSKIDTDGDFIIFHIQSSGIRARYRVNNTNTFTNIEVNASYPTFVNVSLYRSGGNIYLSQIVETAPPVGSHILGYSLPNTGILEIYGVLTYITTDSEKLAYFKLNAIDNPVYMELKSFACEKNLVTKTGNFSTPYEIYGVFRENIDVLNPSVIIELNDLVSAPTYNYAVITKFHRAYFITGIQCVRHNIYQFDLHVDVLSTYDADIREQKGFVMRAETLPNDSDIQNHVEMTADDRVNFDSRYYVTYGLKTDTPVDTTKKNVTFNPANANPFVFCVINEQTLPTPTDASSPDSGYLPTIKRNGLSNPLTENYVIASGNMGDVINFIKDSSSRQSKVVSFMTFPYNPSSVEDVDGSGAPASIQIGNEMVSDGGGTLILASQWRLKSDMSTYLIIADFTANGLESGYKSWMNYEPYCQHELFLPYYGWIQVNGKDIVDKRIIVYYVMNYQTGNAQVNVYNLTDHKTIFTAICQLGVKIPISVSNAEENAVQRTNNGTNLALGLIGGAISVASGVVGNPVGIVGGALSITKAIAQAVTGENAIFERVNGQVSSGNSGMYLPQDVIYKVSYKSSHTTSDSDSSDYLKLNGYITNEYGDIDDYSGYVEVGIMHYVPDNYASITTTEIDEIVALARDGIIL